MWFQGVAPTFREAGLRSPVKAVARPSAGSAGNGGAAGAVGPAGQGQREVGLGGGRRCSLANTCYAQAQFWALYKDISFHSCNYLLRLELSHSHFIEEETGTQKGGAVCRHHTAWHSGVGTPGSLPPAFP